VNRNVIFHEEVLFPTPFVEISKFSPPFQDHVYDAPWEWPSLIPLQLAPLALLPNLIVVPTLPIQFILQTPPPLLEPPPHNTLSPFNEHIESQLPNDPYDQIISSIPSPLRIFSSPHHSTQTTKNKSTKYKNYLVNLVTIFYFQIDELTTIHEALTGLEREQWKEAMEFEYLSLLNNQTWKLETLPLS
jgi:hypothetical protein